MNDVNELWSSAWRQLQKNLASSFAAGWSEMDDSMFASSIQGRAAMPGSSWLQRARAAEMSTRPIQ